MKKVIAILVAALTISSVAAMAQPRAVGVRVGYGVEASYQHTLGSNFIEADLGFNGGIAARNATMFTAVYDFSIYEVNNFAFYAGPGAQLGMYTLKDAETEKSTLGLGLGLVGQVGVEYRFNIPINLSLDWRPSIHFFGLGFRGESLMLGFRYRF